MLNLIKLNNVFNLLYKLSIELIFISIVGRACWSLGNVNLALGNHEKALYFASKHLEISKEVYTNNIILNKLQLYNIF